MRREGEAVACESGQLTIQFERPEACEHCGACDGRRHAHLITLSGEAAVGSSATVDMPEGAVAKASLIAYAMPLLFLAAGVGLAGEVQPVIAPGMDADVFAGLCGLICLGASMPLLRWVDRRIRGKRQWTPQIVSIAPPPNEPPTDEEKI